MKKYIVIALACLSLACIQCKKKKKSCSSVRTGAVCVDNTTSTATGNGACSGHGGVKEWKTQQVCN